MKFNKNYIIIGITILILMTIAFTNPSVGDIIPNSKIILGSSLMIIIYISWAVSTDSLLKKKIDIEVENIVDKETSTIIAKRSIYISIFMIFYSFLVVGSFTNTDNNFLYFIANSMILTTIIGGIYLFYINFYMTYSQAKLNSRKTWIIALFVNLLSFSYFIFVSSFPIIDLF